MTMETPNADHAISPGGDNSSPPSPDPTWWIDDGIPGVGDKPSWLGEKFKTAADLAKSYHELEKRVGTPPDDYDFARSKSLDPDYEPFKEMLELAKTRRVPKDVMDKVIDSVDKYFNEFTTDQDEEIKKLGEKAQERVQVIDNWAKANLSKESYEALSEKINTADAVKALEEIRSKMMSSSSNIPNGNESSSNMPSMEDLQSELNNNLEKYKTDSKYRTDWQRRMEMATKSKSSFVDKFS